VSTSPLAGPLVHQHQLPPRAPYPAQAAPRRRFGDAWDAAAPRVLVALQDPEIAGKVAKHFNDSRLTPTLVFSCEDLLQQVRTQAFGLVVLDPNIVCRHRSDCLDETRRATRVPVLALSREHNAALDVDAVVQPQALESVASRGKALVDMSRSVALPQPIIWGRLELDLRTHQAYWEEQPLHLTTVQFRIMEVLALAAGAVVTTEQLARRVWGEGSFSDHDRVDAHIRRIRKLIEEHPSAPQFLVRVRGRGFRLRGNEQSH
jgi:DNA-binding response OmpR family regulator